MNNNEWTSSTVTSADATTIAYETLGSGAGLIVVGGVLSTSGDYMDLGRELAGSFTVHLMERRGRGASGPQGPGYDVEKECEDLLAVQNETGAERVFGHSYGGLVALQTARRTAAFRQVAVYEPAVALDSSPAPAWLDPYRELLGYGDTRGAFATMVKHAGFAPRALAAMPLAGVGLVLRAGIRGREWQRTEALLEANLAEQQAQLDAPGIAGYAEIESPTLLIGGSNSPPSITAQLEGLRHTIPTTTVTILDGLEHPAPATHPTPVANCVEQFFAHTPSKRSPDAIDAAPRPANHATIPR
jgi:pimeloyl-ACP methyl ester carboxylesterase